MDWLRELPWGVFWFGWGMVALLAGGSIYTVWWARRNAKAIGAQTPVDVSDLTPGYRLVWGRTVGPDVTAPLTGRPCVWWKVQVWESVRENLPGKMGRGSDANRWVWREVATDESDRPLLFGDGNKVAAVWTWGTTAVIPSVWSDWRGQLLPPEDRDPELQTGGAPGQGIRNSSQGTFGPRFRYVEQIIEMDKPFFALGEVMPVDPSLYSHEHDEVDIGNDGSDVEEDSGWRPEPNRLGLVETPDAVIAADMALATWTIGAKKGQPFLLSTEHPEAVSAEQELGAKGGMIMGGIFVALALVLAWARLAG
jgi:hypothetical protein